MGEEKIGKAREIFDARIQFVSLVDAAANKRKFLMTKAEDGTCSFVNYGRILKADSESHYVTGIVYEPMTEDTDGEFMTAEEIRKAAYYYAKNFELVDIQHSFEPEKSCSVVESWIAKADFSLGGEQVKEGTWLMTVEVVNDELWEKIQKGEITGFSMGGVCMSSEEEVDLSEVEKNVEEKQPENKGLLTKFAEFLGIKVVEKGDVAEMYAEQSKENNFWTAKDALTQVLRRYDPITSKYVYETDEGRIREALEDFSKIINGILTGSQPVAKAIEGPETIEKSEEPDSNKAALQGVYESLGSIIKSMDNGTDAGKAQEDEKNIIQKEETDVKKAEVEEMIAKAVAKALGKSEELTGQANQQPEEAAPENVEKSAEQEAEHPEEITPELIEKMVAEAVAKAREVEEPQVTMEDVQSMIAKEVEKAVTPILKANRLPSNLNNEEVKKENTEQHYLHGIL